MLPIIDFSDFSGGDTTHRQAIARDIGEACETVGFLYLKNHGVAPAVIGDARTAIEAFFAEPAADKRRVSREPGHYRGYIPPIPFSTDDGGGAPVVYEAFIVGDPVAPGDPSIAASHGMRWPTPWPTKPAQFRPALTAYWDAVTNLRDDLVRAFALALELPEETFAARFGESMSNMSLLHYLPNLDGVQNTREHHDTNALTILLPSPVGGLEVLHRDGRWIESPPLDGCFVVNIANQMECWSGGRFRSTKHRVKPPAGTDRYSIGYFATPNYDTIIEPLPANAPEAKRFELIHAGRDLAGFVAGFDG